MIPQEIFKKIRQIEIRTNRIVDSLLGGAYNSAFKGRGMEFEEVREYQPGDEVRDIDWNVTARTGVPFIKLFREERELTVMLLVDVSRSEHFGTIALDAHASSSPRRDSSGAAAVCQQKNELAAEFSALIAFSAIKSGDKVGLILFSDHVELFIPPKKGKKHVLRVIRELLGFRPTSAGTNLSEALRFLGRVQKRKATVFVVSDFLDRGFERTLSAARAKHDVVAVRTSDARERELPDVGLLALEDPETGAIVVVDSSSRRVRQTFRIRCAEEETKLQNLLAFLEVDRLEIRTGLPYVRELTNFFRLRQKKRFR
jgi:uncharacterized protein (DUF58 family)